MSQRFQIGSKHVIAVELLSMADSRRAFRAFHAFHASRARPPFQMNYAFIIRERGASRD